MLHSIILYTKRVLSPSFEHDVAVLASIDIKMRTFATSAARADGARRELHKMVAALYLPDPTTVLPAAPRRSRRVNRVKRTATFDLH
jgi:hypothetical protein